MLLEVTVITLGMILSFFLKDVNFLSLNFDFLNTGAIYPDFLLIFVIFFALRKGEFAGIWIGFFAGLLEDSTIISFSESSGEFISVIGAHSLVYTLAGFTLGRLNRLLDRDSAASIVVLVLVSTFLIRFTVWILMGIIDTFNSSYSFLGPAFYTAAIAPIWFTLLTWVYRFDGDMR